MASETLIRTALQLAKQLGANSSKFLGTKSNVSFLGSGPKDGMLFQQNINPESFATIGIKKVLPDIESSMAYLTGGKLNDIQTNKLIDNMSVMLDVLDPLAAKNVVDASAKFGGIDSLRAKSGMVERQVTDVASDVGKGDEAAADIASINRSTDDLNAAAFPEGKGGGSGLMAGLEEKLAALKSAKSQEVLGTVDRNDLPGKTAAAREFLVNTLKVGDDYPTTKLNDVISAEDFKYIMEGGGGVNGDPIVLVEKYFGPRIAELVPTGGTTEEIAIFTKRILNNVEDAEGLRPNEEGFDRLTAKLVDELSEGTYSFGYKKGGEFQSNVNSMGKGTLKEMIDSGELLGDDLQAALNALKSRKADGGRAGYAKGGLAKILEL